MTGRPRMEVSGIVMGSAEPQALAGFYEQLLGWPRIQDEPDWVKLGPPAGGPGLSFQLEADHVPPVWPAGAQDQQMQVHLDIKVDDLEVASEYALALGAHLAYFQPEDENVLVHLDPAGHPFCFFLT